MFNDFKVDLPYLPWTSERWISLIVLQEAMQPVIIAVYCMDLVCLIPFPAKDSTTWLGEHPQYSFSFCSLRWFGDLEGFDCSGLDPIYQLYWMRSTLVHVRLILMNYRRWKKKVPSPPASLPQVGKRVSTQSQAPLGLWERMKGASQWVLAALPAGCHLAEISHKRGTLTAFQ